MATSQAGTKTPGESSSAGRVKLSVDVDANLRRRLRIAAVQKDMTLRAYLIGIVEERLREPVEERKGERHG